jgi:hypothetical protein
MARASVVLGIFTSIPSSGIVSTSPLFLVFFSDAQILMRRADEGGATSMSGGNLTLRDTSVRGSGLYALLG